MSARDEAVEMIRRICPPHLSADAYGRNLAAKFDAHRAEVLVEAAEIAESTAALFEDSDEAAAAAGAMEGLGDRFRRMAAGKHVPAVTAGAPDFFQRGHTYTYTIRFRSGGSLTATFHVVAVSESPDGRQRVAQGWRREVGDDGESSGWEPADADDFTDWTEITGSAG